MPGGRDQRSAGRRGAGPSCCPTCRSRFPAAPSSGLLGPSGCGKTHPDAQHRRRAAGRPAATVTVLGEPAGSPALRRQHRLCDPGAERLRRPDRDREPRLRRRRRSACAATPGAPTSSASSRSSPSPTTPTARVDRLSGGQLSRVSLARRAARDAGAARARRADGRARPRAATRPVGVFRPARRRRRHPAREQPRHGRGEPLRPPAAACARAASSPTTRPRACSRATGADRRRAGLPHPRRPGPGAARAREGARHEPPAHPRHRRPRAAADPARPPDHRAARRRALRAARAARLDLQRHPRLRPPRRPAARDLPVRRHVPRDEHRDAARAAQRHPRAAAHAAAGQGRPARRVRPRLRRARRGAGGDRHRRSRSGCWGSTSPAAPGCCSLVAVVRRGARHGAGAVPLGLRRDRVPGGAVPARLRAAAVPALRPARAARRAAGRPARDQRVLPLSYAVDAMRTITTDASGGADVARDLRIVLAFAVAALAAGLGHAAPPDG